MSSLNKILLILQREYLTRVRKKSFLWMSLIGPVVMAIILVVPLGLAIKNSGNHIITVHEEGNPQQFYRKLPVKEHISYMWLSGERNQVIANFMQSDYEYLLLISSQDKTKPIELQLLHKGINNKQLEQNIKEDIAQICRENKLVSAGLNSDLLSQKSLFNWTTTLIDEENGGNAVAFTAGLFGAILIYFFIFMYGVQVMRGVMEEKTNRIVELVVTSVKPFELMAGKITGIMLVGFTQFVIWLTMTGAFILWIYERFQVARFNNENIHSTLGQLTDTAQAMEMNTILNGIESAHLPMLLLLFMIYFIGGYILYGGLFAAVGSAVDNETDTQQFMLPITFPLIACIVLLQWILQNPMGDFAFWLSIIPFTSPVVMLLRAPFGVPLSEVLLSIGLLISSCVLVTWLAGRIYKVGILSYGNKASWSLIFKWLKG